MEVTHYFDASLTSSHTAIIPVMQGDGTRVIISRLTEGTKPWIVPEGVTAGLSYEIPEKTAGYYDRLSDGQPACTINENEVSVYLAPALTEQSGPVYASIILRDAEGFQVSTFPFLLWVTQVPGLVHGDNLTAPPHTFNGKIYYGGPSGAPIPLGLGDGIKAERQENGSLLLVVDNSSCSATILESDPTVSEWAKQPQKPVYTAQEIGAEQAGTVVATIASHNVERCAHNDIRQEILAIRDQLLAFLDIDEETLDQLSELIAAIIANKTSIEALTNGKVNTSDIIDDLATNSAHKPLSAAQGLILKKQLDEKLDASALAQAQEVIVQQVITALGTPVFGRVDADNNIIMTGELPDGTYVFKYEDGEGNVVEIGTMVKGQTDDSGFVTLEYKFNTKIDKTTGEETADSSSTYHTHQLIPYDSEYDYLVTLCTRNAYYVSCTVCWYDAGGQFLGWNNTEGGEIVSQVSGSEFEPTSANVVPMENAASFKLRIYAGGFELNNGAYGNAMITVEKIKK